VEGNGCLARSRVTKRYSTCSTIHGTGRKEQGFTAPSTPAITENTVRFQFQPLTNEHDDIEALAINVMGFRFVLLLEAHDLTKYPFLSGAKYRPGRIVNSYPTSTSWVTLSWEDNKAHETLTVQWLQRR
jgi:hypothetical protein